MKKFTKDQNKCLSYHTYQAVTANAGSGKTSILVQRYLNILYKEVLYGNCKIEDIVAITFTKKAASEMQTRIIKELNSEINLENDIEKRYKLEQIRNNMIYARISTIHSFCGQLLKEYPIEAGVAYNYQELDDYDRDVLIEQSIDEIFELIVDYQTKKKLFINDIIEVFGYETVNSFITSLLRSNENARLIYDFYIKSDSEIINIYEDEFKKILIKPIILISENYLDYFIKESSIVNKKYLNKLIEINNFIKSYYYKLDNIEFDELMIIVAKLNTYLSFKIGSSFLRSILIKSYPDFQNNFDIINLIFNNTAISFDNIKIFKGEFNDKYIKISTIKIRDNFEYYTKHIKYLIELSQIINENFNRKKLAIPALTFDDILLKTLELLKNNNYDVRNKIRYKIKYLLVDEFQDTNHLQYDIIKYIIQNDENSTLGDKTKLFVVGDDKQSIYGFRSADVRIFKTIKEEIENYNKNNHNIEDNGIIFLKESFRMLPAITAFINLVFANSMRSDISEFDTDYNEFVNGRIKLEGDKIVNNGSVNFLMTFVPKNSTDKNSIEEEDNNSNIENEDMNSEAKRIADFINYITNNEEEKYKIEKDGILIAPKYQDIAIIARNRSIFPQIGEMLLRRGIPYEISKGTGFFQAMEIIDLISVLKFFADNNDNISFVSVLKSPMFNLDDNYLIKISAINRSNNYWERFEQFYFKNPDDLLISRAYKILNEFKNYADKLPMQLLLLLLIEKTSLIATVSNSHKSQQIKANIDRFLDYVKNFESKGFKNISDLILQINTLMENSSEPEAAVFTGGNSVKILTVHSSKGLEFPIVILANTNYYPRNDSVLIDKDFGVNIKFAKKSDGIIDSILTTPINNLIIYRQRIAEEAETKRLLYVALSRAKDHLIISSKIKENKKEGFESPRTFLKILFDSLGKMNNINRDSELIAIKSSNIHIIKEISNNFKIYLDNTQKILPYSIDIEFINNFKKIDISKNEIIDFNKKIRDNKIESFHTVDAISATKLTSFFTDQIEYDFKYFLGLTSKTDTNLEGIFADPDRDDEQIIGARAGTYIHYLMQNINYWLPQKDSIDMKRIEEILIEIENKFSSKINDKLKERIISECSNITKTKFISRNYDKLKNAKFEITYSMPINDNILNTTIDMMIYENNNVIICDWKTNKATKPSDIAEQYQIQMRTYAFVLSYIYPLQNEFICKLLLTRLAKDNCEDNEWIYEYKFQRNELLNYKELLLENINYMKYPIEKIQKFNISFNFNDY